MSKKYSLEIEQKMQEHYKNLNEKDKRHYAGIEALKLGHGCKTYLAKALKCDRNTIAKGIKEITKTTILKDRIRNPGGGRKNIIEKTPEIKELFYKVIGSYTAGSPMEDIRWTHLKAEEIAELISKEKEGLIVSVYTVKQLLKDSDFKQRKMHKDSIMAEPENRDAQFLKIEKLKAEYEESDNPIVSIDVKKKSY